MSRMRGNKGDTGFVSWGDFKKLLLSSLCALCGDCGDGGDGVFGCGDDEGVKGYKGEGWFSEKVCQMGAGGGVDCRGELGGKEWIFIDGGGFAGEAGRIREGLQKRKSKEVKIKMEEEKWKKKKEIEKKKKKLKK